MSVKTDPSLMKDLRHFGLKDASKCFHCGNCTAICPLSTPENPFPRKLMKYAQMGLKDKILKSPEPWLCYYCGDCSDRLELFAASGVDAYHFEWQVDAKMAVNKVGHLISLVGNINNPKTLYQGTPDDVYRQVRYSIAAGVNIIGPECAIPLATPIENLKAIVETAHEGY